MNVFDVLREKLGKCKDSHLRLADDTKEMTELQFAGCYTNAIEIVNQVEQEFTPKTNADRIRAMTDEELADAMLKVDELSDYVPFCGNNEECNEMMNRGELIQPDMCKKCLMNWLGKEVD